MAFSDLLLQEFEQEAAKTRKTLARVPSDKKDFAPHPKSTPLGRLAPHVAQLPQFGLTVLTSPGLDFTAGSFTPVQFDSGAELVKVFDSSAEKVRQALQSSADSSWNDSWTLSFNGSPIFQGSRFLAFRQLFVNHVVHHRAQIGVYLRLLGVPVPSTYGPSADES